MNEKLAPEMLTSFVRLITDKGYRRSGNNSSYIFLKDFPDERLHLMELDAQRLLCGILYKRGFASEWEDAVKNDFPLYHPLDCHFRKAFCVLSPDELNSAIILADNAMNERLTVSKEEDTLEWKQKYRAFRKWFHALLSEYGFKKVKSKSTISIGKDLVLEAQEQKSVWSDIFYFNFEVNVPWEKRQEIGFSAAFGRWHEGSSDTLDWLITPQDTFEKSMRTYLSQVISPIINGGVAYLLSNPANFFISY